ncbi:nitroreductase family protein [Halodesulfovibrio aestuarii]|uniref:nitroreductase family protein n=1 Tax=Halodesulfovibrio aestuarii TaxID=126333 RepID=UPI003D34ED66
MLNFKVDTDKCIKCGECAQDCLYGIIGMDDYPFIHEEKEEKCIGCQHCLAVCKTGALSILGKDPANSASIKGGLPAPNQMETLILSRRSIRRYKKEGVDPELIHHMLHVVDHAPTAVNQRQNRLTVIDNPEFMDKLREQATAAALKVIREGNLPKGLERTADFLKGCEDGKDIIFRNAPHLLVASAPKDALAPMADCHIAMSYFELLANSHGLGTVWDGIAKAVLTMIAPELLELIGIPEDHTVVCVMAFGKPAVKYHRAVQHSDQDIHRAVI